LLDAHARNRHQLVGGQPLSGRRVDQRPDDSEQLLPRGGGQISLRELRFGLRHRVHAQGRWEHLRFVLLSLEQCRFLQPRHGGTHARVVRRGVAVERTLLFFEQNLAGGRDHLAPRRLICRLALRRIANCLSVRTRFPKARLLFGPLDPSRTPLRRLRPVHFQAPQRLQNRDDFAMVETRPRRHRELTLHVARGVQQHTARRRSVAPGATRFLQIVLERTRDVGVHHQAHVRFVDAHAERVRRDDRAQGAVTERPLHVLLTIGQQAGVKMLDRDTLLSQKVRDLFGALA
jgi:hypothetical protein